MPASSLVMGAAWARKVLLMAVLGSGALGLNVDGKEGTYKLGKDYSGNAFFDGFEFFTDADPTHGFVNYVNRDTAARQGLISVSPTGTAYIGVDYKTFLNPNGKGRDSVRITTKQAFTHGLIISDIANMPGGICGTWPAHWSFGPNWPSSGEIDIIEGVNSQTHNMMTLHSDPGCSIAGLGQTGALQTSNCDANVNYNSGCGVRDSSANSYGTGFNNNGGGVFATEWTSDHVQIWFFPASGIPRDIQAGSPDPSKWGTPNANLRGACDIDKYFKNHNLIFDTTFCGDWASNVWTSDAICAPKARTCNEYVAGNPSAFKNAFWAINSVKVYDFVPSPKIVNTVGAYSYHGCYTEAGETGPVRTLSGPEVYDQGLTLEKCAAACRGFKYFGTEFGNECYCGNSLQPPTSKLGDANCDMACAGNPLQFCGSANRISMFRLTGAPPDPPLSTSRSSSSTRSSTSLTSSRSTSLSTSSRSSSSLTSSRPTTSSSSRSTSLSTSTRASSSSTSSRPSTSSTSRSSSTTSTSSRRTTSSTSARSSTSSSSRRSSSTSRVSSSSDAARQSSDPSTSSVPSTSSRSSSSSTSPISSSNLAAPTSGTETLSTDVPSSTTPYSGSTDAPVTSSSYDPTTDASTYTSSYSDSTDTPVSSSSYYISTDASGSASTYPANTNAPVSEVSTYSASGVITYSAEPTTTTYEAKSTSTPCSTTIITTSSTSTVYATSVYTITSCASTVTNCPARIGHVTTDTISLYTTICPVTLTKTYPVSTSDATIAAKPYPQDSETKDAPTSHQLHTGAAKDEQSLPEVVFVTVVPVPTGPLYPVPYLAAGNKQQQQQNYYPTNKVQGAASPSGVGAVAADAKYTNYVTANAAVGAKGGMSLLMGVVGGLAIVVAL